MNPLDRQPARLRDEREEAAIHAFDAKLEQPVGLVRRAAKQIGLAGQRGGPDAVDSDSDVAKRPLEAWKDSEHADRAGDRARLGENPIADRANPIAAARSDRAERDDDR